jgi:hypothetical protein
VNALPESWAHQPRWKDENIFFDERDELVIVQGWIGDNAVDYRRDGAVEPDFRFAVLEVRGDLVFTFISAVAEKSSFWHDLLRRSRKVHLSRWRHFGGVSECDQFRARIRLVRLLVHEFTDEALYRRDLTVAEDLGAVNVPGSQVGPGAFGRALMLGLRGAVRCGRQRRMFLPSSLISSVTSKFPGS